MEDYRDWTLERLESEARWMRENGLHKLPDYAGVDKYDWSPDDAQYRLKERDRYYSIVEEIQNRIIKMSE